MLISQNLLSPVFLFAALIAAVATVIFFFRHQTHLSIWGGMFSLALAVHMLSHFLVLTSSNSSAIRFWFQTQVIALSCQMVAWLFFIFVFNRQNKWSNWRSLIVAGAIPALVVGKMLTQPELDSRWIIHNQVILGSFLSLTREIGWLGSLFIIYALAVAFLTLYMLLNMLKVSTSNSSFRILILSLSVGLSLLILAEILDLLSVYPIAPFSNLQLAYTTTSLFSFFIAVRISATGLLPIARSSVLENIQDAVLVLDQNNNLVDINLAGQEIIENYSKDAIGKPISKVWLQGANLLSSDPDSRPYEGEKTLLINGTTSTFDIKVSPVMEPVFQASIGQVIVLRNVTGRERMEKTLQERTLELTRTNKLITALSMVASHLGAAGDSKLVLDTLGTELRGLGLDCAVVSIDPAGDIATIRYVSYGPPLLQVFEKIAGFTLVGYEIPKRYWPGDRLLKTKAPVWYSNPKQLLRGFFARIPERIRVKASQLLDIQSIGLMCILPLISEEKVIGAMLIWGVNLHQADSPILEIFASQVAGILQKTRQYEEERRLNLTLARSKAFTSALSTIAAAFSQRQDKQRIFDILGMELAKLGLGYLIVRLSEDHQFASVENISTPSEILSAIKRFTGVNLKGYVIDRKYWGALAEEYFYNGQYLFSDNPIEFTSLVIPKISSGLLKKALEQSRVRVDQKAIYLPLINDEKAYGILGIWGVDLQEEDAPALSVFASQVSGMLQNAASFENETRRAKELTRSNSVILALSKVAAKLESSSQPIEIFETVGKELETIGIGSIIGLFDEDQKNLQIQYVSVKQDVIRWAEKMTSHTLNDLTIPRHLWPTDKVITEKTAYWDPNLMKGTLNMFPVLPESLQRTALKMAGININDPVCYLPIANEYHVLGVLAVWGIGLEKNDIPALTVLANQLATAIRNADLYETEARRARESNILLKASEATSSSLDINTVLLTLASQLLELSGFQSCNISEWDKNTNLVYNRAEFARVYWKEGYRDYYSLRDYPRSNNVLLTGDPIILQGDFEAEERQWMDQLGRTAVIILALKSKNNTIGLVEIATTKKNWLFDPSVVQECQQILAIVAEALVEPLTANDTQYLFEIETQLLKVTQAEVCSFSEWDQKQNSIFAVVVASEIIWENNPGTRFDPNKDVSWKLALQDGKATAIIKNEGDVMSMVNAKDGSVSTNVEALVIFPLQKGEERIGLIELYDFNYKTRLSSEQITFLRTIVDKAGYSIENAHLLQLTQKRLKEKEVLLKEIHHRVKNNLQIISSLLDLQSLKSSDPNIQNAFHESQVRLRAMALIHEKLYQSQSQARIDFGEYVKSLTTDLFRSYQFNTARVKLNIQVDETILDLDRAVSFGLILNELITNVLKYAFPADRTGNIWVELQNQPGHRLSLRVADDGVGIPMVLDINNPKTLGLQLITNLTDQLDGTLEINRINGTVIVVAIDY